MLVMPALNLVPYLTFGRLRPLHTNAVIFAFCHNAVAFFLTHAVAGADVLLSAQGLRAAGAA